MREWRRSTGRVGASDGRAGLAQRIERVMNVTVGRELVQIERYMTFLASVGSTAPFIGLFGTVWGIMNRSEEHTSELQSLMRISYAVFCLKKKKSQKLMRTKDRNI